MKKRILLAVAYDGTGLAGFQVQKSGVPTVEGELNRAVTELTRADTAVEGASRTDAGVHARCNLAVFDTESPVPPEKFAHALNVRLPEQIRVTASMEVPEDFHPRRCSTVKTYEYRIYNARIQDPVRRLYTYHSGYRFDIKAMREAAAYLVGEHDFRSFCSVYTSAKTTVREILSAEVQEQAVQGCFYAKTQGSACHHPPSGEGGAYGRDAADAGEGEAHGRDAADAGEREAHSRDAADAGGRDLPGRDRPPREIVIRVSGRGFLYNMVRIIAGTLMEVGRGALAPDEIPRILASCDRRAAGPTAPACGLTLVRYEITEPGMERVFC